jgi:hypothetical protein
MTSNCSPKTSMSKSKFSINVRLNNLAETGRLQFFYHSPRSKYPVRDVTNEQGQGWKLEPHIEKNAENYYDECYQNNIIPFLCSDEKYLFLFTNCKNGNTYRGKQVIVGYIVKENGFRRPNKDGGGFHYAVQGETKLFSFQDAFPLERLVQSKVRMKKCSLEETKTILNHFKGKENVLTMCINEINRLEREIL